jgi:hypothetical protein
MVALVLVLVPVLDESVLLVVPDAPLTPVVPVEPAFQLEPPVVSPVVAFDSTALPLLVDEVALEPLLLFIVSVELQAARPKASMPATTAVWKACFMSFSSDDWMTP